jgi:hypothetical protein
MRKLQAVKRAPAFGRWQVRYYERFIVGTRASALPAVSLVFFFAVRAVAGDPPWAAKPMPDWSEADARQILTDSPWAKAVKARIIPLQTEDARREGGNMGLPHGIGFDGFTDDRPREQLPTGLRDLVTVEKPPTPRAQFLTVRLRWESALPIRVAELKSNTIELPTTEGVGYKLAVYGIPTAKIKGDPETLGAPFKSLAALKREGKEDAKPSAVEVFQRQDGLVIVFEFPPSTEISRNDRLIEFRAEIGRVSIIQTFDTTEMMFQGRLEL